MNQHTQRQISRIFEAFRQYQTSRMSLSEFQGTVEGTLDAFEGSDEVARLLRWLTAELETIRFMSPECEHQAEIERCMERFRTDLSSQQ